MKYTRKWSQLPAHWSEIATKCRRFTDDGWSVHTIVPLTQTEVPEKFTGYTCEGGMIVAFKDEPDLTGGVPR